MLVGDRIIAFAVMIQSLLVIMQTIMIGVFYMDAEATTVYRVAFTAVPMIVAMIVAFYRHSVRFIVVYAVVITLLLLTCAVFPANTPYVIGQSTRFLLPVVLPSALCLLSVTNFRVVENTLYIISWFTAVMVFYYIICFFRGIVSIYNYNMTFSYACLLPMVVLYAHRKAIDVMASGVLFISVLAIGSRGAAFCFLIYLIFDLFQHKSKWRFVVVILVVLLFVSLPFLVSWFDTIGVSSRTIDMFLSGEISNDSGRSYIQKRVLGRLLSQPFIGLGFFGDRIDDVYCHNILLEICLNFGLFLGPIIILFLITKLIVLYYHLGNDDRNRIIRYFCALVLPFMTSGSYLIGSEFAIFIGLCYLINKNNHYVSIATR